MDGHGTEHETRVVAVSGPAQGEPTLMNYEGTGGPDINEGEQCRKTHY